MSEEKTTVAIIGKLVDGTEEPFRTGESDKGEWKIYKLNILAKNKEGKQVNRYVSSFNKSCSDFDGKYVKIKAEKKVDGKYTNYTLKNIEEMSKEEMSKEDIDKVADKQSKLSGDQDSAASDSKMSKGEWIQKDMRQARSSALASAVGIAKSELESKAVTQSDAKKVLVNAEMFYEFIWNGYAQDKEKPIQKKQQPTKEDAEDGETEVIEEEIEMSNPSNLKGCGNQARAALSAKSDYSLLGSGVIGVLNATRM